MGTKKTIVPLVNLVLALLAVTVLAGLPLHAAEQAELAALFSRHKEGAVGFAAVRELSRRCAGMGPARCGRTVKRWQRQAGIHPLSQQALAWLQARQGCLAGERQEAQRQVAGLGVIRTATLRLADGTRVALDADPGSGVIQSGDTLELTSGFAPVVTLQLAAPEAGRYALRIAATHLESVCQGERCVRTGDESELLFDQVVVPLDLLGGVNDIALHFSGESGRFQLLARVTTPAGRTAALTTRSPGHVWGLPRGLRTRRNEETVPGLQEWLPPVAGADLDGLLAHCLVEAAGQGSSRSAVGALAARHVELGADGWPLALACAAGTDQELSLLTEAAAAYPESQAVRLALAAYQTRQQQAWNAWQTVRAICPDGPPLACLQGSLRERAVTLLRDLMPAMGFSCYLARTFEEMAAVPEPSADLVLALAEEWLEEERLVEAAELLGDFVGRWPGSEAVAMTLLYVQERLGRLDEARRVTEQLAWLYPTRLALMESLASLHERLGQLDRARELYGSVALKAHHHPTLLERAAQFYFRIGDTERAVALWEEVLGLRPQAREIRELVKQLTANAVAGLAVPVDEQRLRDRGAHHLQRRDARYVGLQDETHIRLYANGAHTTVRVQAVLAVQPRADEPLDLGFVYDSHREEATILRADVLRFDGSLSPQDDYGEVGLSDEAYNLYYDMRQMVVPFDDLSEGDLALLVYEVETAPSALGAPFSGVEWLQDTYPKTCARIVLEVPADRELFHSIGPAGHGVAIQQTMDEDDGGRTWSFDFGTIPPLEDEPYPPGHFERALHLHYSTMETWQLFANWYAGIVSTDGLLTPEMEDLVARLAPPGTPRREATEALCRAVADDIRYVGLELGVHGLKPYPPAEVFARGFGDCKDKSLLLVTLLGRAGIPAYLTTVTTIPRGRPGLYPGSPSLFDHAIVYLAEEDCFFDATARYIGLDSLPWQDEGAQAIVIDPKAPRKVTLPVAAAERNQVLVTATVTAGEGLQVTGEVRFSGQFAWRVLQSRENRAAWENSVEGFVSSVLPVVALTSVEDELTTGDAPVLAVRFTGRYTPGEGRRIRILTDANTNAEVVRAPERTLPLVFGHPYVQRFTLTFAPGTLRFQSGITDRQTTPQARFTTSVEEHGEEQTVRVEFAQLSREVPVVDYAAYRALVVAFEEALSRLQGGQP